MPALAAGCHLALQILHKPVAKMIFRPRTPRRLSPFCAAMGTSEFHPIVGRIAVERRPARVAETDCFQRCSAHMNGLASVAVLIRVRRRQAKIDSGARRIWPFSRRDLGGCFRVWRLKAPAKLEAKYNASGDARTVF